MSVRFAFVAAVIVFASLCGQARTADDKGVQPTSQLHLRSLDDLIETLKFLNKLTELGGAANGFEQMLKQALPKGFEGVDSNKPIFAYAGIDAGSQAPFGVLLVPISNEAAFFKLIEQVGQAKAVKDGDFHALEFPVLPMPIFLRIKDGYACASPSKSALQEGTLRGPGAFQGAAPLPTVRLQIRFDRLPEPVQQASLSRFVEQVKEQEAQVFPGESASARALRLAIPRAVAQVATTLFQDGEELNLEFDLPKKRDNVRVQLDLKAKAKTPLANFLSQMRAGDSLFARWSVSPMPVMQFAFHVKLPAAGRELVDLIVQDSFVGPLERLANGKGKRLHDALKRAIEAGELDVAYSWRGPNAKGFFSQVAAVKVLDAEMLETLTKDVQAEKGAGIKLGVAGEGGFQIHSLQVGDGKLETETKLFGENKLYFAFRKDALLLAMGEDGLAELRKGLLASPGPAKPFQGELNL